MAIWFVLYQHLFGFFAERGIDFTGGLLWVETLTAKYKCHFLPFRGSEKDNKVKWKLGRHGDISSGR